MGGSELYNAEYARRLHERGHRVTVFTWAPAAPDPARFPFEVLREPRVLRRGRIAVGALDAALSSWRPDVVFVCRGSRKLSEVVRCAARHAPVVVGMHELARRRRGRLRAWRIRRIYGLDRAARVVVSSSDTRDRILEVGVSPAAIDLVTPGVDTSRFSPDPEAGAAVRRELGLRDGPVLLTVSRLAANKGHEGVMRALPALRTRFPDLAWIVVGEGRLRGQLEALAKELGVRDVVHFTGRVPDARAYYNACDVFAMPSSRRAEGAKAGEGFGISYVEAGACGKPVLASASGGGREIVLDGETGRLVEPADPGALEAALTQLLAHPDRARAMGASAREHVKRFDWSRGARALERSLRRAAASG